MKKQRLLDLLVSRFPEYSREELSAFIACRNVTVCGEICGDPKQFFPPDIHISLSFESYVSRGGVKLEHALHVFPVSVKDLVMLDAGSSTGGFTDCLLQHGASCVHAVDVGTNQLDWRLRTDSRVIVHERRNIMTMEKEELDPPPQGAVCDLSFRSISGAASRILSLVGDTFLISLIKPQFETPKGLPGFHGVVEDPALLSHIMVSVYHLLEREGVTVEDVTKSPIKGAKGNVEYLALLSRRPGLNEAKFVSRL
jgi:23S rRNA (cytidine1920-2'-O)/16S rRNA (cytidine1409-2'-O)-methyltransferase